MSEFFRYFADFPAAETEPRQLARMAMLLSQANPRIESFSLRING
jgi:hypothetical protein